MTTKTFPLSLEIDLQVPSETLPKRQQSAEYVASHLVTVRRSDGEDTGSLGSAPVKFACATVLWPAFSKMLGFQAVVASAAEQEAELARLAAENQKLSAKLDTAAAALAKAEKLRAKQGK